MRAMNQPAAPRDGRPVLLYDGVCGFCDLTVQWVLRADRRELFRFAPLQGEYAAGVLARHPELDGIDSLVLVEPTRSGVGERSSVRSEGALRVASLLGGAWKAVQVLRILPRPLRDSVYDAFARRRYRLFGRYDACSVPPPEVRERFLD